jgi:hypothetical protein
MRAIQKSGSNARLRQRSPRGRNGVAVDERSISQFYRVGSRNTLRAPIARAPESPVWPRSAARPDPASTSHARSPVRFEKTEEIVKKIRFVSILAILVAVLSINVAPTAFAAAASAVAVEAVAEDLPCYDLWTGCLAGGGSANFCEGMWCGCMQSRYGYICSANVS